MLVLPCFFVVLFFCLQENAETGKLAKVGLAKVGHPNFGKSRSIKVGQSRSIKVGQSRSNKDGQSRFGPKSVSALDAPTIHYTMWLWHPSLLQTTSAARCLETHVARVLHMGVVRRCECTNAPCSRFNKLGTCTSLAVTAPCSTNATLGLDLALSVSDTLPQGVSCGSIGTSVES